MTFETLSISIGSDLANQIKEHAGGDVSAWMTEAARARLRQTAAQALLSEYEHANGVITSDELQDLRRAWLG